MSNFPGGFDDDVALPFINNNLTEIGGEAVNALRDAVVAIQQNIGLTAAGSTGSIANRLGIAIAADGQINSSALTSLGLVTLPITDIQISPMAQITESKLRLDHRTQDLFNYIRDLSKDVNLAIGWVSVTGVKLEPHLLGAIYRHTLNQIDVTGDVIAFPYLNNKFRTLRNNLDSYHVIQDINNELLAHQFADGSPAVTPTSVITNNGSVYPATHAHTSSGIFLNTSRFSTIPQTANDVQIFAEFIDSASIFLLGSRIQNLYSNGISRSSRSSSLTTDGYGQPIVPVTSAIAYLKNIGNNNSPFDNINTGDDIIEFKPSTADSTNNSFDAKFALVKIGDIVRVNYGTVEIPFVIKEKKYIQNLGNKKYIVRVAGKNLAYAPNAQARIDRPLFYNNKYGVLSIAAVNNNFSETPSLIVASPRGGEALGIGFSPDQFDEKHYLLYLALYPTGSVQDGYTILPPIDITGNLGVTPGLYTLDSVVEATNNAFSATGYNYRFVAFSYKGEFGIMLSDAYNNAAFSILSGVVTSSGFFDQAATNLTFTNNVIDLFPITGTVAKDPLGFGPYGANIASPPYMSAYGSAEASQNPTKLFVPLNGNNYYVNGVEKYRLSREPSQALDPLGDGYWVSHIIDKQIFPGPSPAGRVQVTYRVALDLSASNLKVGKTVVIQSLGLGNLVDFGRFIIQSIVFGCTSTDYTDITVYDAVHAKGFSPSTTLALDGYAALYFNSDSVSFNNETATDYNNITPFKRHFEVYLNQDGNTFTHERGRFLINGTSIVVNDGITIYSSTELSKMDILKISPKLRGYQFGSVNKITLQINNYDSVTGIYDGYLASYDGVNLTRQGPTTFGKRGEVTRFYDETTIDYIDIIFDINISTNSVSNQKLDFQLFPTLSLDDEIMLIGTCQLNGSNNYLNRLRDERQFGNIAEKELSTSALNFIALPERLLHFNGVIRGLDIINVSNELISLRGGVALVDGKFQNINDEIFTIPKIKESYSFTYYPTNWILCLNSIGEYIIIPMLDYDSVLGTPNAPTRLFSAFNVVSSNTYTIDCTTFSNLLNNRKDLTILYIISSTVTGSGTGATVSLSYKDVRRFINDQDSNIPAIVTNDNSQGNFKNFASAATWIKLNNSFQNTIQIKGAAVTSTDPLFGSNTDVNILSQGVGASLTINSSVNMSNVKFTNLTLVFNGAAVLNNVTFTNCIVTFVSTLNATNSNINNSTIIVTGAATLTNNNILNSIITYLSLLNATNGSFDNCTFSVAGTTSVTNIFINRSIASFTGVITATDIKFINCTLTFTAGGTFNNVLIDPSIVTINGTISLINNNSIIDSVIQVNIPQAFSLGTNFKFERNTVTYAGAPGGGYDTTNLVNDSYGMMYADVTTNLTDIIIRDNTFSTAMSDRLAFFSLQLSNYAAVVENVDISKNKFISTHASIDDIRAVISIVSTLTTAAGGGAYPKFPKLVNVLIENNMCNHNQMILVSTKRLAGLGVTFSGAALSTTNVRIANNTCGTIGFITAGAGAYSSINAGSPNNGLIRDKEDQLIISGNSCKLISNIDYRGDYIPFTSTNFPANIIDYVSVGTGAYCIDNNTVNWIQVGCSSNTTSGDGAIIINNRVHPANPIYLNNYADTLVSVLTPSNVGILLRRELYSTRGTTYSIISGNIITQKPLVNSSGANVFYYYDAALVCFNNATIANNSVVGVVNTVTNPFSMYSAILYLWSTCNAIVTGNNFDRDGYGIQAYVKGQAGATNTVSITDNIFDSQYIDISNTIETVGIDISITWKYHSNKNQIMYAIIPMAPQSERTQTTDGNATVLQIDAGGLFYSLENYHILSVSNLTTTRMITATTTTINPYLPEGVKILQFKYGAYIILPPSSYVMDTGSDPNQFNLLIKSLDTNITNFNTSPGLLNSILDVKNTFTNYSDFAFSGANLNDGSQRTALNTSTVYYTIDVSGSTYWTNNKDKTFVTQFYLSTKLISGLLYINFSPIVVKYIW